MAYFPAPVSPTSSVYRQQTQFSYSDDQNVMDQGYTSNQCYNHLHEWSDAIQPPPIYLNPQQHWEDYYPSGGYTYYDSQY